MDCIRIKTRAGFQFGVDKGPGQDPAVAQQGLERAFKDLESVRRVDADKGKRRGRRAGEHCGDIFLSNAQAKLRDVKEFRVGANDFRGIGSGFHKQHFRRSPAYGFKAKTAAAGEKIQHARCGLIQALRIQHGKKRFTDDTHGRAKARTCRAFENASLVCSGNDAHGGYP